MMQQIISWDCSVIVNGRTYSDYFTRSQQAPSLYYVIASGPQGLPDYTSFPPVRLNVQ